MRVVDHMGADVLKVDVMGVDVLGVDVLGVDVMTLIHLLKGVGVVGWCDAAGCRGVLLIWMIVEQRPTVLAVGADGVIFSLVCHFYHFSVLSPLWETARYGFKYYLKGPLKPQTTNQPNK